MRTQRGRTLHALTAHPLLLNVNKMTLGGRTVCYWYKTISVGFAICFNSYCCQPSCVQLTPVAWCERVIRRSSRGVSGSFDDRRVVWAVIRRSSRGVSESFDDRRVGWASHSTIVAWFERVIRRSLRGVSGSFDDRRLDKRRSSCRRKSHGVCLALSLNLSSSYAFIRSLFRQSSHTRCGRPRFLQPPSFCVSYIFGNLPSLPKRCETKKQVGLRLQL